MNESYKIPNLTSHELYSLKIAVMSAAHKLDRNGNLDVASSDKFLKLYDKLDTSFIIE